MCPRYVLCLGLGSVPAEPTDVLAEIGDRLDAYHPVLRRADRGLQLQLTVVAADVWVAVLLAMTATAGVGYPVLSLDAAPAEPNPGQRGTVA